MSLRDDVFAYVKKKYKAEPEYLWRRWPDYAVLRHAENRKWFGIVMNVPPAVLGPEVEAGSRRRTSPTRTRTKTLPSRR